MSSRNLRNMSTIDRALRAILGAAILSLPLFGVRSPWIYVGLLPLVTAAVGFCPLYALLGISTRKPTVTG